MKILIAEDDPVQRRLLTLHLNHAGHEVEQAGNGRVAWELLQREHRRFVITDWMMPDMDGLDLIRRIRAGSFPGYTYVMLLTALDGKHDVITGLEAGADDYLTKPFNSGELRLRVSIGERILSLEARLREMATHDSLTGLFNRRAFDERLADEMQRAQRYHRPLALMMLDIDNFKNYNDTNGHPKGDVLLHELASLLNANVRATDFVARYGGEEFAIILTETMKPEAMVVAERIRSATEAYPFPLRESQPGGVLTLSLGVASYPEDVPKGQDLLEQADQALYRAKRGGRNRIG